MVHLPSRTRLAAARREISLNLSVPPGHAAEALARALGFRTYAALLAEAQPAPVGEANLSARAFIARLAELGHQPDPHHAACAVSHALDMLTGDAPEANTSLLISHGLKKAWVEGCFVPWMAPWLLACRPIPDPGVRGFRLDRDALRFDPDGLVGMTTERLHYVTYASALHHASGLPARIDGRPRASWERACHAVVDGALKRAFEGWRIEIPTGAVIAPPGSVPESYHDGDPEAFAEGPDPVLSYGTWHRAKGTWPETMAALLPPVPLAQHNRKMRPHAPPPGVTVERLPHLSGLLPDLDGPEALAFVDGLLGMLASITENHARYEAAAPLLHALMDAYPPMVVIPAIRQAMRINGATFDPSDASWQRLSRLYGSLLV